MLMRTHTDVAAQEPVLETSKHWWGPTGQLYAHLPLLHHTSPAPLCFTPFCLCLPSTNAGAAGRARLDLQQKAGSTTLAATTSVKHRSLTARMHRSFLYTGSASCLPEHSPSCRSV